MQKKNIGILSVVLVIILGVGGYFIFHKSPKPSNNPGNSTNHQMITVNNSIIVTLKSTSIGDYLAATGGKALYTVGSGDSGVNNCSSSCLTAWPIYQDKGTTTGLPTNIGTIKRSDNGEVQYTYKGKPLYFFASDSNGQVTGNGISGFSVATP